MIFVPCRWLRGEVPVRNLLPATLYFLWFFYFLHSDTAIIRLLIFICIIVDKNKEEILNLQGKQLNMSVFFTRYQKKKAMINWSPCIIFRILQSRTNSAKYYSINPGNFRKKCLTLNAWEKGTILIPKGRLQVPNTFTIRQFFTRILVYLGSKQNTYISFINSNYTVY